MARKRKVNPETPGFTDPPPPPPLTPLSSTAFPLRSASLRDDVSDDSTTQYILQDPKKKKTSQARIGQACDRCRTRKLTCDPAFVCGYCAKAHLPCLTTDRLTGKVHPRGELERLKRNTKKQLEFIKDLEARLRALGDDVRPYEEAYPTTAHLIGSPSRDSDDDEVEADGRHDGFPNGLHLALHNAQAGGSYGPQLPDVRTGQVDKYLGVSTASSNSSAHKSKLKMLGYELPISTSGIFDECERGEPQQYNRSYTSFIASTFDGASASLQVELPVKEHGLLYAEGYLRMLNAFLPILHKPTFLTLLQKFYDYPNVIRSPAENVLVHMMFASILLQYALRNGDEDTDRRREMVSTSNRHYHYSLSKVSDLMASPSTENVQALAMICEHVRFFPDPEIGWTLTHMALNKAVELGLHRSVDRSVLTDQHMTPFQLEMRKRIFWSLFTISVTINGKLGRPMPLRIRDFDVEIPDPLDDDHFNETSAKAPPNGNCSFLIAIEAFKVLPIFMVLYDEIHSTRRSSSYVEFVRSAEKRIEMWCEQWPPELRNVAQLTDPMLVCFNHYLNLFALEFRLLLFHPSLSLSNSAKFNDMNLKSCMDTCHEMMSRARSLKESRNLDTTWCSCAVYVLAIQTTLYGHSQLSTQLTPEALKSIRSEMDEWLSIMGHIGCLLGIGRRLQSTMQEQVDAAIIHLERRLIPNVPHNPLIVNTGTPMSKAPPPNTASFTQNNFERANHYRPYGDWNQETSANQHQNEYLQSNANLHAQNSFPMAQYHYPDPSSTHTYSATDPSYVSASYPNHLASQALAASSHYQTQTLPNGADNMYHNIYDTGPQSWNQYTQALPPVHDYNSASALLQLGAGRGGQMAKEGGVIGVDGTGGMENAVANTGLSPEQQWPWLVLGNPPGST